MPATQLVSHSSSALTIYGGPLRGLTVVPADQRWFWTEQWQAGECEAAAQIASGQITVYSDAEAMFTDLDQ